MSAPIDMYNRYTVYTDPSIPEVAGEIRQGVRQPSGTTDIHDHLSRLRAAARGNVVEIGVRYGVSTAALLQGVVENGGHLYSLDISDCSPTFAGHPQWTFIQGNSSELCPFVPDEIQLLFVDGDHSYEGVFADLEAFGPRSKVIMAHDANEHENPQVLRAIEKYFLSGNCRQQSMTLIPESHGLAILE